MTQRSGTRFGAGFGAGFGARHLRGPCAALAACLLAAMLWGGGGQPRAAAESSNASGNQYSQTLDVGIVSAAYRVVVDGTSRVLTDPNLGAAVVIPDNLSGVAFIPESDGNVPVAIVRFNMAGTASTTGSPAWPNGGMGIRVGAAALRTTRFVSAGSSVPGTLLIKTPG